MRKIMDLRGHRYGRWTCICYRRRKDVSYPSTEWLCRCDCGRVAWVHAGNLRDGKSSKCKVCGSRDSGMAREKHIRVIDHKSAHRCFLKNFEILCKEWKHFPNFLIDCWSKRTVTRAQLYPKDPARPIGPDNTRWAEGGRWFSHGGEVHNLAGWAKKFGISRERMRQRVNKYGWPKAIERYL